MVHPCLHRRDFKLSEVTRRRPGVTELSAISRLLGTRIRRYPSPRTPMEKRETGKTWEMRGNAGKYGVIRGKYTENPAEVGGNRGKWGGKDGMGYFEIFPHACGRLAYNM